MRWFRKVDLILPSLCFTVGGAGFAMPMDPYASGKASVHVRAIANETVPMPSMDEGTAPANRPEPDWCETNVCDCGASHAFLMSTPAVLALRVPVMAIRATLLQSRGYVSPVLALPSRPPIA